MAIVVQQSSSSYSPVYNDVVYIISSSNVAQTNFKFVVDIYDGVTLVDRLLIPPHPVHLTGFVNIASLLESRVSKDADLTISDDKVEECTTMYSDYSLSFGESYGSSGTIYTGLANAYGIVWNAVFDYEDYCSFSSGDYIGSASNHSQFLTNRPSSGDIMADDNAWLYFATDTEINSGVRLRTYNTAGTLLNTYIISGTTGTFLRVPSGYSNINAIPNGNISGGTQPLLTGSVAKYSLEALNGSSQPFTDAYWYTIVDNCSRYEKHRIQFLNKLGGYDTFNFTLVSKGNADIERSTYKNNLGSYASANSFVFSPSDRAKSQFYTKITDTKTITSDWVNEETYNWLEELVTSPDVYLDNGTNLIPINVTNSSFETKKTVNEKLFNLTLTYTLSYNRYRQRI